MSSFYFASYPIKPVATLPPLCTKNFQKTIKHLSTCSWQMSNIDKLVFCTNRILNKMIQLLIPLSDLIFHGAHSIRSFTILYLRPQIVVCFFPCVSQKCFMCLKKHATKAWTNNSLLIWTKYDLKKQFFLKIIDKFQAPFRWSSQDPFTV